MREIQKDDVLRYNKTHDNGDLFDVFLRVNSAHLEEDIGKLGKNQYVRSQLEDLLKKAAKIHLKILQKLVLTEEDMKVLEMLNRYNVGKKKQLRTLLIMTIVFTLLAIAFSFLPRPC